MQKRHPHLPRLRNVKQIEHVVTVVVVVLLTAASALSGQERVTLRAARLLDGRGGVVTNPVVVMDGGSIQTIRSQSGDVDYDLTDLTVLPGLIDTHVHVGWHFDPDGRLHSDDTESAETSALYAAENAYKMLMAGFTTVQSLGSLVDKPLRDAIDRGVLPGPRILTSLRSIGARTGEPDAIRIFVRKQKSEGADVIKIFASASIRDGGTPTMSQAQLDAACGEAQAQGLRAVVHAHGPESARRSVEAGCTTIEHGALLDEETLSLMAERGVYFDPNTHLIFQNYFENKDRYLGIGNYNEEGFAQMEKAVPSVLEVFRIGLRVPGLDMVFGTDGCRGSPRAEHRRADLPRRDRRTGSRRGDRVGDVARCEVAWARPDGRSSGGGNGGRPHRRRGEPSRGHHRASSRALRNEGREGLEERAMTR